MLETAAILAGTALLIYGADRFVIGASATARNLGMSPMLIGLTIVGFATSAPEILVSITAALKGASAMAVGNALGSNIANIGLVLGAAALIKPIMISDSTVLKREMPVLIGLTVASTLIFMDDYLGLSDGIEMLFALVIFMFWIVRVSLRSDGKTNNEPTDTMALEFDAEIPTDMSTPKAVFWLVAGLLVLLGGANTLVWGASELARLLGVSELIIGLTIVAIGTSLPELAVTVISAYKGEAGLAMGNIVGSNIYNLLAVIGVAGVVHPVALDPSILRLHFPIMVGFTIGLYLLAYNFRGDDVARISRGQGMLLLGAFLAYHAINVI